ncbi:F-box domain-containing protein [Mycena sanguinolenta]|uniref:F-box domain-containing protein n=1 Tax=Mycena sanguinolenta TaxID=230812 RepID=A0A8H6X641_9AGAR|nr:F-box domain-containing protein [Mycena sanguinolenta]
MKLSVGLLALACAASASPLRVIVVSNNGEPLQPIPAPRPVGADGKLEPAVAHLNIIKPQQGQSGVPAHVPCGNSGRQGFRFREKATAFADELRIAFGFKPSSHWHGYQHPPKFEELKMHQPLPFIGGPDRMVVPIGIHGGIGGPGGVGLPGKKGEKGEDGVAPILTFLGEDGKMHTTFLPPPHLLPPPPFPPPHMLDLEHPHHGHRVHPHPEHFHRIHHAHWRHANPSFLTRVHFALMSLGPWEGRAVAFVLGCGIGVLLRMFWVLTVLTYRAVRGPSSSPSTYPGEEYAEQYVILEGEDGEDAEEIFVAPPMYTYPVEKVALPVEVEVPAIVVSEAEAEETK